MMPLLVPTLAVQSLERSADALARAEKIGDPVLLFWAASLRRLGAACSGDIAEVDRCDELAGSLAAQLNEPALKWAHTVGLATRALIAGDPVLAEQLATEAFQIGTEGGQPDSASIFVAQLMTVSFERGNMGDTAQLIEEAAEKVGITAFLGALALAHSEADRIEAALQLR